MNAGFGEQSNPGPKRELLFGAQIAAFCPACGKELALDLAAYFRGHKHLGDVFYLAVQKHHARGPCQS